MMNRKQIEEIIPHREPFIFLDEVIELIPGEKIVARKNITGEEDFFRGHFPGIPVMPGVLVVEAIAQAGAIAVMTLERFKGKIGFLAGVEKTRFRRKVFPGDTLTIEVFITNIRGAIGFGKGTASVNGEKAVSTELSFAIQEP